MKIYMLKSSIDLLKQVKIELERNDADSSILLEIDQAINKLEEILVNEKEYSVIKILNIVGNVISFLPSVIDLINMFR